MPQNEVAIKSPRTTAALAWGMAAGPLAWACDEAFSYSITQHACSTGHHYVLHVSTLVAFIVALSGAVTAYRLYRAIPDEVDPKGGEPRDRAHFQALYGIAVSLSFALVIIALAVPRWMLSACD
jgi:hypothetical protein